MIIADQNNDLLVHEDVERASLSLQSAPTQNFKVTGGAKGNVDLAVMLFLFYHTMLHALPFSHLSLFPNACINFEYMEQERK